MRICRNGVWCKAELEDCGSPATTKSILGSWVCQECSDAIGRIHKADIAYLKACKIRKGR